MDKAVGRLLRDLDRRGFLDRSIVVVTADHGEALEGDHGYYFSHGRSQGTTRDQVHVPLVLWHPGCVAVEPVERPVSTIDIKTTVFRLLGLPPAAETDGVDLFSDAERMVTSFALREVAVRLGPWKARWSRDGEPLLFHMERDPNETTDLSGERPTLLKKLRGGLAELRRRRPLARAGVREDTDDELRQHLRGLGYL